MPQAKKKSSKKTAVIKKPVAKKHPAPKKASAKSASAVKQASKATKKTAVKAINKSKPAAAKPSSAKLAPKLATPIKVKAVTMAKPTAIKKPVTIKKPVPPANNATLVKGISPYSIQKGENYMNAEQNVHFRKLLLAWRRELMEEVERTVHHMQDEAANFPDPNDRATQESEFNLELRARERERKLIKKIDEALTKLENHEYGYCDSCGIEIGVRRLEARPTASLCIDCKELDEIKERHYG